MFKLSCGGSLRVRGCGFRLQDSGFLGGWGQRSWDLGDVGFWGIENLRCLAFWVWVGFEVLVTSDPNP